MKLQPTVVNDDCPFESPVLNGPLRVEFHFADVLANRPLAPYEHERALNYSSRPTLGKVRYDDFALSILLVTRH